jgi:hypothetical protein
VLDTLAELPSRPAKLHRDTKQNSQRSNRFQQRTKHDFLHGVDDALMRVHVNDGRRDTCPAQLGNSGARLRKIRMKENRRFVERISR